MNKKYAVLGLSFLLLAAGCINMPSVLKTSSSQQKTQSPVIESLEEVSVDDQLTTEQKTEDLNYLCDTLIKNHKNIYHTISKEEFQSQKNEIMEQISSMEDDTFYFRLRKLVAIVGDEHTTLSLNDYDRVQILPLVVSKIEDKWYVTGITKEFSEFAGYEIKTINHMPINEIYHRAKSIISSSNEAWSVKQFSNYIFMNDLRFLGVVETIDEASIVLMNPIDQTEQTIQLESSKGKSVLDVELTRFPEKWPKTAFNGERYRSMPLNNKVYFIQYNSCLEDPNFAMKDFVEQVKTDLEENSYENVIVDLRYNGGGDSSILNPMVKELEKLQKKQTFKAYTLIGGGTMSSAMINSFDLKNALNCTFVGMPTGGSVNHYGEMKSFQLPNLPVTVTYSTKYFVEIPNYDKDSLYPDIAVEHTYQDVSEGIDSEVELVLAQ